MHRPKKEIAVKKETICPLPDKKRYVFSILMNGETYTTGINGACDIKEAILSFKPEVLYTEVYVIVDDSGEVRDRKLTLIQGKKLFNDEDFIEIFINNLLLS